MKKNSRMLKKLKIASCLSGLLMAQALSLTAQVVNASNTDVIMDIHNYSYSCSTDVNVYEASDLNCDMLDVSGDKLWALAYTMNDRGMKTIGSSCVLYSLTPVWYSGVTVRFTGSGAFPSWARDLYIPNGDRPDVVIGQDISNGWGYYTLGVVYNSTNSNNVELMTAPMTNVGTGSCTLGAFNTPVILNDVNNGRVARNPHIDLFGSESSYGGNHALYEYAAVWSEYDPNTGVNYIMLAVGNINNPGAFVRTQITPNTSGDPQGAYPDVAGMGLDCSCGNKYAWITYLDPANYNALMLHKVAVNSTYNVTGLTAATLESGFANIQPPRIECSGFKYYGSLGPNANWEVVAGVDPGSGYFEVHSINDVTWTPIVSSLSSTEDHYSPVVAGVGTDMAGGTGVGATHYSIAYYSTYTNNSTAGNGDIFENSIDYAGGLMTNSNYYEVNSTDLYQASVYTRPDDIPIAITSSSNSGDDLLTVWFHGWSTGLVGGSIDYKFSGNSYAFKPSGVIDIAPNKLFVYPNPATEKLNVRNAGGYKYTISDMLGRVISSGEISKDDFSLNTSRFEPGVYIADFEGKGTSEKIKFTKQ